MCITHPSAGDTNTPANRPQTVPCRICGQPMTVVPWDFNGKDLSMITCQNPKCAVHNCTFTVAGYDRKDFTNYLNNQ